MPVNAHTNKFSFTRMCFENSLKKICEEVLPYSCEKSFSSKSAVQLLCKDLTTGCGNLGLTLIQNALFELPLCCKEVLFIAWPLVVTDVSDQSIQSGF